MANGFGGRSGELYRQPAEYMTHLGRGVFRVIELSPFFWVWRGMEVVTSSQELRHSASLGQSRAGAYDVKRHESHDLGCDRSPSALIWPRVHKVHSLGISNHNLSLPLRHFVQLRSMVVYFRAGK